MLQALELLVSCSPADVGEGFLYSYIVDISHEKRRRELEHVFLHDVLNSASAVESLAYLLEDMAPSAEAAESVGILKRTSSQLLSQIEGQRQLTEAEDGNLKVHFSSFGSLDLVREIVSDFQFLPVARDRLLVIAPGSPDVRMVSDPVLVRRVLENLVRNALEASEPSETVTVGCSERNGVAEFHVHNRAVMSQEVQLQVFQRSFSTKGDARGLGTYGVRLLTERYLKGGVGFESVAPHGTTFTVTCPIAPRAGPTGRAAPARR
jgi:signal transduction histidine kinase